MWSPTQNLGLIGPAVLTFIGYKQTNRQTDIQSLKIDAQIKDFTDIGFKDLIVVQFIFAMKVLCDKWARLVNALIQFNPIPAGGGGSIWPPPVVFFT